MKFGVIGAEGATGKNIVKYIEDKYEYELYDLYNSSDKVIYLDLLSKDSVDNMIKNTEVDILINCVGTYTNNFSIDLKTNVIGTQNLLSAISNYNRKIRLVMIGSSAEYGIPLTKGGDISEDHPLNPINNYGLTKKMQFDLFKYYLRKEKLDLIYLRPFNLFSKEISENLFIGSLYKQIRELKNGNISRIKLGYLGNYRDYIDIQDAAMFYVELSTVAESGAIINIGTGNAIKIKDLLQRILLEENLDIGDVEFLKESKYKEVERLYADISVMNKILKKRKQ